MWGVAEGVCELVGPFDLADVVLEVMYHGMVFMIFGEQNYKKDLVVDVSFSFSFVTFSFASRQKKSKENINKINWMKTEKNSTKNINFAPLKNRNLLK
jgi:hypothetical protein